MQTSMSTTSPSVSDRRIFNLWLLLGGLFLAGVTLVAINAVLMVRLVRADFGDLCATARDAFEDGGPEALKLVLRGVSAGPKIRVHLLDGDGRDLATGEYRARPGLARTDEPIFVCGRPSLGHSAHAAWTAVLGVAVRIPSLLFHGRICLMANAQN
jgi:hypothetical protein